MAILNNSNAISSGGYDINNSLRFRSSASAYLNRTFTTPTDSKKFTLNMWFKLGYISAGGGATGWKSLFGNTSLIGFGTSDLDNYPSTGAKATQLIFSDSTTSISWTPLLRDPSAWYMITLVYDSTQATASNRLLCYLNGVQLSVQAVTSYPTLNLASQFNIASSVNTFGRSSNTTSYLDGYMADVNFIDGQALTPTSFGETDTTTGVWKPKAYSGTYGTNGFYLKFSDIATTSGSNAGLGKDFSGNANYWTTNNISVTAGTTYDAMIDSPTLTSATVANYCTFNPVVYNAGSVTYTQGNLLMSMTASADRFNIGTLAVPSGKFYWEMTINGISSSTDVGVGIIKQTQTNNGPWVANGGPNSIYFNTSNGWSVYGSGVGGGTGTFANSDVLAVALDMDNNIIYVYKNNTLVSSKSSAIDTTIPHTLFIDTYYSGSSAALNCGQRPFSYTPPTGFVALNTYNLPDSTIKKGNTVMDATLYTGNSTTVTATNAGAFKPDLVWIKDRTGVASHVLTDSVRGTTKQLFSNLTNAEQTDSNYVTSFNSNGFTVGTGQSGTGVVNNSGDTFVGWQWQAGQGTTSSNTSGTITSTVSVNATAGFSIVTYTGTGANATVGHGLGVAPKMMIVKVRSTTNDWPVYHAGFATPATSTIFLNLTNAVNASSTTWNSTAPTSSVFSIGTTGIINASSATYVAYCWAEIAGFSKFGSYTGNGSADGPFVYTGFRPKFIIYKVSSGAASWVILDTSRTTYNVTDKYLLTDAASAEGTFTTIDILSNGFKVRTSDASNNPNGGTIIYMAFAENPFKNSNAR